MLLTTTFRERVRCGFWEPIPMGVTPQDLLSNFPKLPKGVLPL